MVQQFHNVKKSYNFYLMVCIKIIVIIVVIEKKQCFPFTNIPYKKDQTVLYCLFQIHPAGN